MSLYDKWLRLWADKPVLDLVDLINNNPELVQSKGLNEFTVGDLEVYFGSAFPAIKFAGSWYDGCSNTLIRRAISIALVKQQEK